MKRADSRPVLVVGGGIAGLAMARSLDNSNVPVVVYERRSLDASGGLAINLPGNAIQALARLGLADEVRALGTAVKRREYRDERGRVLFAVDEVGFWGPSNQPRCIRRSDLSRLLAQGMPADICRRDCAVTSMEQDQHAVRIRLADGAAETGRALIGADGVNSTVRQAVFGGDALSSAILTDASWRFMAPNPGIDCWTLWAGTGGIFLLIPVDRGEVYGWMTGSGKPLGTPAQMQCAFEKFPHFVRDTLATVLREPTLLYHSPLEEIRIPKWSENRVFLIGDAAHATAPVWAQGAALSLEDALVLSKLIAEVRDWSQVGPEFERQRRGRVAHVQVMTDRMSRMAKIPTVVRNALLPILGPRSYRTTYGPLRSKV